MFKLLKAIVSTLALGGAAYLMFFVPFGNRSLFQHMSRIAKTEQAQELGAEFDKKYEGAKRQIAEQLADGAEESLRFHKDGDEYSKVRDDAKVRGDAKVRNSVKVRNSAKVRNSVKVRKGAKVRRVENSFEQADADNDRSALRSLIDAKSEPNGSDKEALSELIKRLN